METEESIEVFGERIPKEMYNEIIDIITPDLKGFKYGCAPPDFSCPICLSGAESAVVMTECDHMYHVDCLEKWLENINTCPECRNVLPGSWKTIVENLLLEVKERMKILILQQLWNDIANLPKEELGVFKTRFQEFIDTQGWNVNNQG